MRSKPGQKREAGIIPDDGGEEMANMEGCPLHSEKTKKKGIAQKKNEGATQETKNSADSTPS